MAIENDRFRSVPVFWTNDDEKSGDMAIIPGISRMTGVGNVRPKVKGHKTKEVKAGIPRHQPLVDELTPKKKDGLVEEDLESHMSSDKENSGSTHHTYTTESKPRARHAKTRDQPRPRNHSRKVSFSDLCVEDKKRVANLIKELAKQGEEKESAVESLRSERVEFEGKIMSLLQQKELIMKERNTVETQLNECQQLLIKYQDQIAEHQEKLVAAQEVLPPNRASTPLKTPQQPRHASPNHQDNGSSKNVSFYTPGSAHKPSRQTNVPFIEPERDPVAPPVGDPGHYMAYPPHMPPHGYPYPPYDYYQRPPVAPYHRPYTNQIDEEIATERYRAPPENYRPEPEYWIKPDYYESSRKRHQVASEYDVVHQGPLNNPLLSSTQKSGMDVSQRSRNHGGFEPLVAEMSSGFVNAPTDRGRYERQNGWDSHRDWEFNGGDVDHRDLDVNRHRDLDEIHNKHRDYDGTRNAKHLDHNHRDERNGHRELEERKNGHFEDFEPRNGRHYNLRENFEDYEQNGRSNFVNGYEAQNGHRDYDNVKNHRDLERNEYEDKNNGKFESPISTNFHDHINNESYGTYYKKLTPEEQRREMLSQKEALIREKRRLRKILNEHESMLREKQKQLHRQQEKQRSRMKVFEKTGEFPLPTDTEETGPNKRDDVTKMPPSPPRLTKSPVQRGTVDCGTSPLRFIEVASEQDAPELIDVGTAMTQRYESPLLKTPPPGVGEMWLRQTPNSLEHEDGRQGNLPLVYNRQKTTPRSSSQSTPPHSERALSIVEIVDSMEGNDVAPSPQNYPVSRGSHVSPSIESEEDHAEESRLLEDVFFLK